MRSVGRYVAWYMYMPLLCLMACNSQEDIFSPEIVLYQLQSKEVAPGEGLTVFVEVRDNQDLNQMRFRIREAFNKSWEPWNLIRVIDLDGRSFAQTYQFLLPDSAQAGLYELGFQVVDFSGNASIDSLIPFTVNRPGIQAEFVDFSPIPTPDTEDNLNLSSSDSILFTGNVIDAQGLNRVVLALRGERGNSLLNVTYQLGDTMMVWEADSAAAMKLNNLQESPVVLQVKAFNRDGHQSRLSYGIDFTP